MPRASKCSVSKFHNCTAASSDISTNSVPPVVCAFITKGLVWIGPIWGLLPSVIAMILRIKPSDCMVFFPYAFAAPERVAAPAAGVERNQPRLQRLHLQRECLGRE